MHSWQVTEIDLDNVSANVTLGLYKHEISQLKAPFWQDFIGTVNQDRLDLTSQATYGYRECLQSWQMCYCVFQFYFKSETVEKYSWC